MVNQAIAGARARRPRPGFTLIEALVVLILIGVIGTLALPNVARTLKRNRSDRALEVIKGDMENAFSLASRQGRPVTVNFDTNIMGYTVRDRASNRALFARRFDRTSPYGVKGMWVSNPSVTIFPSGFASTNYWIRFDWGDWDWRWILVRRTGQMREWGWM